MMRCQSLRAAARGCRHQRGPPRAAARPMRRLGALAAAAAWLPTSLAAVTCPDSSVCPDVATCCPTAGGGFACCPASHGVCCGDGTCCPGPLTSCAVELREDPLVLPTTPPALAQVSICVGATSMATQGWWEGEWHGTKLAYNLCPTGLPLYHLDMADADADEGMAGEQPDGGGGFRRRLAEGVVSKHTVGYFSNAGELGSGYHPEVTAAIVAAHGGLRNADAYFCAVNAMAPLAGMAGGSVAVFAPRFLYYDDGPMDAATWEESSELYWNGSKPYGDWRSGGEADPAARDGQTFSTSSYLVLDRIVGALLEDEAGAYPQLKRVVVLGHSAGGQLVHRYALTRKEAWGTGFSPPFAPPAPLTPFGDGGGSGRRRRVGQRFRELRFVVMNPSSFTMLDDQRWDAAHAQLLRPPQLDIRACPEYNDWHYGLDGPLTPYVAGGRSVTSLVANYGGSDVVYLAGEEDTCNSDVSPGCNEHTLDRRCPAMYEGYMRRERATLYHAYLQKIFSPGLVDLQPPPVHSLGYVPSVGHDHFGMFHSAIALDSVLGCVACGGDGGSVLTWGSGLGCLGAAPDLLAAMTEHINEQCCSPGGCTGGLPTTCSFA